MKDNLKNMLLGISIFYSVVIVCLMLYSIINSTTVIEISDLGENEVKLNEYKNEVSLLENNSCTNSINKVIDYYEKTSYEGEVDLKDMYIFVNSNNEEDFYSLPGLYSEAKDNCHFSDAVAKEYNLTSKIITALVAQEEMLQKYLYQYELGIKDVNTRAIIEPSLVNIEYQNNRSLILEIISDLIDIYKEGLNNE